MKTLLLVKKYTLGLVNALKDDEEFSQISQEFSKFSVLLSSHAELARALANPFIPAVRKMLILREVLAQMSMATKTTRFLLLLLEHDRFNLFPEILKSFPVLWHEKKGVSTFEVSSVVDLNEAQRQKLKRELERLEKRPVFLQFRIDPSLIAGLALRKGNVIYDASLRGHLRKLREQICEG